MEDSVKAVTATDLYCHPYCWLLCTVIYKHGTENLPQEKPLNPNIKCFLFLSALLLTDLLLTRKDSCTSSHMVEFTTSLLEGEELQTVFLTRDMKQLLVSNYGESITIAPNSNVNESALVFSSSVTTAEMAVKLKNHDKMKEATL